MNQEKKTGGKAPAKNIVSDTSSQKKKQKKRPFVKKGVFSISKIKHNIKKCIKQHERFEGNVPSVGDNTLNCLATIAVDVAKRVCDTAGELAKKVGKQTIGSGEIMAAVGLEMRGELKSHCVSYMKDALAKSNVKKKK
ncbi:hypothetical protein BDAP_001717 [Binucleata daphniae]